MGGCRGEKRVEHVAPWQPLAGLDECPLPALDRFDPAEPPGNIPAAAHEWKVSSAQAFKPLPRESPSSGKTETSRKTGRHHLSSPSGATCPALGVGRLRPSGSPAVAGVGRARRALPPSGTCVAPRLPSLHGGGSSRAPPPPAPPAAPLGQARGAPLSCLSLPAEGCARAAGRPVSGPSEQAKEEEGEEGEEEEG